jgi:hypothetical protein
MYKGCKYCSHYKLDGSGCKAFPDSIPISFASGNEHTEVVPGQVGDFVYKEIIKPKK